MQLQLRCHTGATKLLIDGRMRPSTAAPCASGFLQEVHMNATCLPDDVSERIEANDSSDSFGVSVDGRGSHVDPRVLSVCG